MINQNLESGKVNISFVSPGAAIGNGAVKSVNGKTGVVILTAEDVHALPEDTYIPSTDGLATMEYVEELVEGVEVNPSVHVGADAPENESVCVWVDLDGKPTEGLATEKYVDEAIAAIPSADLNDYYTKAEVDLMIPITTGFITMSDVEGKGYQTEAQVNTLINAALGVIENGTY